MATAKKKRGRPPTDPLGAPAGRAGWHVGVRLNEFREAQMGRVLEAAQARAREADLPTQTVTASSLIVSWIIQRLDEEIAKLDAEEKRTKRK